jgi:hypothetical protein
MANKLADTSCPVDALEASNTSIAYQMRDIRHSNKKKTVRQQLKEATKNRGLLLPNRSYKTQYTAH